MTSLRTLGAATCALVILGARAAAAAPLPDSTTARGAARAAADSTPSATRAPAAAAGEAGVPELVTDRPDYTESAETVPLHSVQVEAGATLDRTDGVLTGSSGELLLRIGVRRGVELRVGLNSYVTGLHGAADESLAGREDASLGVKLMLLDPRESRPLLPAVALIVATSVPTGSAPLRHSALEPEAKLAFGWSLPAGWGVSSNLNLASARCEEEGCVTTGAAGALQRRRRVTEAAGSLSVSRELSARVGAYAEWFGGRPTVGGAWQYGNAGLTLGLAPTLQLDVRAGTGLGRSRGDYFVGAGIARRF